MLNILISPLLPLLLQPKVLEPDRELVGGGQLGLPRDHRLQSLAGDRGRACGEEHINYGKTFSFYVASSQIKEENYNVYRGAVIFCHPWVEHP